MLFCVRSVSADKHEELARDKHQAEYNLRQYSILIPSQDMGNFRVEREVLLNYADVQLGNTRWTE